MKKKYFFILFFIHLYLFAFCQKDSSAFLPLPKNNVFFEIGGNCLIGSLNYERVLYHKQPYYGSCRGGFLFLPQSLFSPESHIFTSDLLIISLMYNNSLQISKRFAFEVGTGTTFFRFLESNTGFNKSIKRYGSILGLLLPIGIKFFYMKRAFIKLDVMPVYSVDNRIVIWGGLTISVFCWNRKYKH
jgi:hypothetical protein